MNSDVFVGFKQSWQSISKIKKAGSMCVKSMRRLGCHFMALAILLFVLPDVLAQTVIGINIENAENKVIRLYLPARYPDSVIKFEWYKKVGVGKVERYEMAQIAREGTNLYEMRRHPFWKGEIAVVAVLGEAAGGTAVGEIIDPSIYDELAIFLRPQKVLVGTINLLYGNSLFGIGWNVFIFVLLLVSAAFFAIVRKKSVQLMLLFGFVVGWAAMDMRTMYDRIKTIQRTEKQQYLLRPSYKDVREFIDESAKRIGSNTWTKDESWQSRLIYNALLNYGLAEHKYVPPDADNGAAFILSARDDAVWLGRLGK